MKMVSIGRQAGLTLVLAGLVVSLTGCGGSFDNDVSGATSPSAVNAVGLEFTRTPQPETGVTPGPVIQPAPGFEAEPTPEPGAEPGPVTEPTPGPVVIDPTPGPVVIDPAGGEPEGEPIPIIEPGFDGRLPPPGNLLRTPATCEALRDFFEPKYQSGAFQTIITNTTVPDYTPVRLRTDSWISYIPEIPNLYPGQEMVVVMSPGPIDYSVCPPVLLLLLRLSDRDSWSVAQDGWPSPCAKNEESLTGVLLSSVGSVIRECSQPWTVPTNRRRRAA